MSARRAALLATTLLPLACSYDLTALRGVDAAVDRPRPVDLGVVDRGVADVGDDRAAPGDTGRVDAGTVRAGTCDTDGGTVVTLAPPVPATGSSTTLAYAMARGDLVGATGLPLPTVTADGGMLLGCPTNDPVMAPPTRVYRYQVVEGGTVTATTNTQHCTSLDTRVYAIWSCKAADVARPAACGDDLENGTDTGRCPTCGTGDAGACAPLMSTIETPTSEVLRRGDTVFFAVTGFSVTASNSQHRIWVGENAARVEPFPSPVSVPVVSRCTCQANTDGARTVSFPYLASMENFPLSATAGGASFLGVRDSLPTGTYSGVSMQLRVARWTLSSAAGCAASQVRAVFDLIVGSTLVTTFSIPATLAPPVTVAVPYTAFTPIVLTRTGAGMAMELRLRSVLPQAACLTIELEPTQGASAVTLYGG